VSDDGAVAGAPVPEEVRVPADTRTVVGRTDEPPPAPAPTSGPGSATGGDIVLPPVAVTTPRHRRRWRAIPRVPRIRVAVPRSRPAILALVLALGGIGMVAVFTGASLIRWTETADFCGRCHQMAPELKAYEAGIHDTVTCGECHVEPGPIGWIKSKIRGTEQLFEVVLGAYPKPIPAPNHADLPSTKDTCQQCHSVEQLAVNDAKISTQFAEDEPNTRQAVGLMIRPASGVPTDVNSSVHWHVLTDVEYWSSDPNAQTIDMVQIRQQSGYTETFIAQKKVTTSDDVQPDITRLQSADAQRQMDCLDCHNRAGHDIPDPRTTVDAQMAADRIDPSLPYIKRESMQLLWASYPDVETADTAIDALHGFYRLNYPAVAAAKSAQIDVAIADLKDLYRQIATPEMKVTASTYPDNLGHLDFPGCFRCHDGAHYLVKDGQLTNQAIPSTCNTCHTFPQVGGQVATLPLGTPPQTHTDSLWVFDHAKVATSKDPGGQSCGDCHAKDYCDACHDSGAINVNHDQMLTQHAASVRAAGNEACAYCHQPPYCAQCHTDQVLPVTGPYWGAKPSPIAPQPSSGPTGLVAGVPAATPPSAPPGIRWPLLSVGIP
jgi:nitrate/TMAO reductase-like tetraheme cytochrome c subunit